MSRGATRRSFLAAAGAAGVGAAIGAGAPDARAQARSGGDTIEFYGEHQAGIATPAPNCLQFLSLDVVTDSVSELSSLLKELSHAAALMSTGAPVGALQTGPLPPVDTGEAVGLPPARLTVTFGIGPSVFENARFGLASRRPAPLVELPSFSTDALEPALSGGDLGVQVCAEDPQVAFHAVHDLIRLAGPAAVPRWSLAGFGPTLNTLGKPTPRNLMGFKDGTANIVGQDEAALRRFVWVDGPGSPAWMRAGSYMVVRRIEMLLGDWDSIGLDQQERTFGRQKLSGAPLGEKGEFEPVRLGATTDGRPTIPSDSHIRLASPPYNHGQQILRRGYSYVSGIDRAGDSAAGGLLFVCYQRDPRKQFIPIQRRLAAHDALNRHIKHVGSAIFACPPGARRDGFVGETLL